MIKITSIFCRRYTELFKAMKNNARLSFKSQSTWKVDLGFQHPICTIRSYHVIAPKDCLQIISASEEYAQQHGGWTKDRHQEAATTDIPFDLIGGEKKEVFQKWKHHIINFRGLSC